MVGEGGRLPDVKVDDSSSSNDDIDLVIIIQYSRICSRRSRI